MDLWFSEKHTPNVKFSIRVDRQLYSGQSDFQRIDVFESPEFGRILVLDGYLMLTEKDEFIYHEMIVHTPLAVHPHVKNVLVIGAGDGGAVRELTRYPEIGRIDLAEIDGQVIEVCKKFLPQTSCKMDDPRVHIYVEDGLKFVRAARRRIRLDHRRFDRPVRPGRGAFTKEFYRKRYKASKRTASWINQHESPFYEQDALAMQRAHKRIIESFPFSRIYQAHIPTYPSGHWLFGFSTKKYHPLKDLDEARWNARGLKCRYYTTTLHRGAFYLPAYVEEMLEDVEEKR